MDHVSNTFIQLYDTLQLSSYYSSVKHYFKLKLKEQINLRVFIVHAWDVLKAG